MPPFLLWLNRVLADGESVQSEPPRRADADYPAVAQALADAFRVHALDVAGPPVPYLPRVAHAAAFALADGCWRVASGTTDPPADDLGNPDTPAAHLSADVCLRFLPAVYRRARARGDADPVAAWAGQLLRRWPLSGARANLGEPAFADHPGLMRLYAERQPDKEKGKR